MAARELAAADAFFARVADEPALEAELDRRQGGPVTPLITALAEWEDAPLEGSTLLGVNEANARRLTHLLADAWPGLRNVGADGADAAWMLAQHADRSNDERRAWLPTLRAAVDSGDADPRHLATLTDRVAAVGGEQQTYGTIVILASDGEPEFPLPVADAGKLEARRAEIGLPTVAAEAPYLAEGDFIPYGPDRGSIPVNQWPMLAEGHVSVEAVLEAGVRPVQRVWAVRPGDRRLGRLRALAHERGVIIDRVEAEIIDELASGRTHGGVIALVGARRERSVPDLLAEVVYFLVFVAGHLSNGMAELASQGGWATKLAGETLAAILPNLETFNVAHEIGLGQRIGFGDMGWCALYALTYSGAAMVVGVLLFRRREVF